ncbi:MAG: response regulator transcription factor [Candidatus Eremiobacteraeota bacterium]|nr:response regulator transcription factor [Candidatus Eremiobacteraeota bacterium]
MPALRVLIAENDRSTRELLDHHLQSAGFDVIGVGDGLAALRAGRESADLIVLDVGLPGVDGFDVVRQLRREKCETPIIMLTARIEEVDRVVGFELGADDYICKPFSIRELMARIRAITRRSGMVCESRTAVLQFGRLEIDEAAREARIDGADLKLKPREFSLLLTLATNVGIALSRETLLERVWGFDFEGDERTVDVHVRRLRIRFQEQPQLPQYLVTIHGFGYKFART